MLIKKDGGAISGSPINGKYFSCTTTSNGYWVLTALKDCEIYYISSLYGSSTYTIIESKLVAKGGTVGQTYDGITVVKVLG